ncbi:MULTISPECIES: DUF4317 family protein [unclassified Eubacterium (in: firmicutes)]|uniref:DUF4317 family protein n=1 Tax=unclassified Eubacterium (in: firmicutes) TaxID=2624479 RepID=UPI001566D10E|nr:MULTISPECIES: DUF4317 family protein [unclassified Eubacterium (in: firmicutes)]
MIKSKFKRVTSLFLATLMCVTTFAGIGSTTAYAASGEKADVYMVDFPRDGDANYDGVWGHSNLTLKNGWHTGRSNFTNLKAIGSYSGNVAYCIEPGISLKVGQTMNKYDENYFNNLAANGVISGDEIRLFVGRILQYGYYSKKPDELQWPFIEEVLGCQQVLSSGDQKEVFQTLIADTLGEDRSYEIVKNIHENLNEMLEANKEDPEPLALAKPDVKRLLEESGVPSENLERFEEEYEHVAGEKATLLASNITNTRQFEIHTPDITIKVNPDRTDLVETRVIDGRQCLVIAVDDHVEVNGLDVWTLRQEEDV